MRHDPPRIVYAGATWASDTEVQMPPYVVNEAEIAAPAAYRAMVAKYREWADELGRALFGEEVPVPTINHEAELREKVRATLRLLALGLDDADLAELTATHETLERALVAVNEARRAGWVWRKEGSCRR